MSSRTRCFAPSAHSLKAEERNRAMLDKLPTELVLTIAELGAPQIAPDRKSLAIVRRRYFVSLAAVSRALYAALRPYIWEHVQTKGEEIQTLVEKFTRDPRCAEFVKELVCADFSQPAFAKLWALFLRFVKLTSLAICGLLDDTEPLQLCMLERLPGAYSLAIVIMDEARSRLMLLRQPALKYLHLRNVLMSKRLPKIARLESLCLDGRVRVHRPLGQDVPIMPDAIITRHSTVSKKTLRLLDQDSLWHEDGADEQYCLDALSCVDVVELDAMSFSSILDFSSRISSTTPCFVLTAHAHDIFDLLQIHSADRFPVNLQVWVAHPRLVPECVWSCFQRTVTALCNLAIITRRCDLRLTLPVTLGCTRAMSEMKSTRAPVYAVIKHLQHSHIALSFYQHPTCDLVTESTLDELEWLGLEDNEGYFTELLEGRCSDPELRDFKIVMVD